MVAPLIAAGVFEIGKKLIDKLIPDPEQKAKAELELLRMEREGETQVLAARMQAIVAEASSADPWTSRARPSFLYVFYCVILSLTMVAPIMGIFFPQAMELFFGNVGKGFTAIPEELWWTFTAGYLGYAGFRTFEKRKPTK